MRSTGLLDATCRMPISEIATNDLAINAVNVGSLQRKLPSERTLRRKLEGDLLEPAAAILRNVNQVQPMQPWLSGSAILLSG